MYKKCVNMHNIGDNIYHIFVYYYTIISILQENKIYAHIYHILNWPNFNWLHKNNYHVNYKINLIMTLWNLHKNE